LFLFYCLGYGSERSLVWLSLVNILWGKCFLFLYLLICGVSCLVLRLCMSVSRLCVLLVGRLCLMVVIRVFG